MCLFHSRLSWAAVSPFRCATRWSFGHRVMRFLISSVAFADRLHVVNVAVEPELAADAAGEVRRDQDLITESVWNSAHRNPIIAEFS